MNIKINVKSMEEIIGCWIDTMHILNTAVYLREYTCEASKLYEKNKWQKKEVHLGETSLSMMMLYLNDLSMEMNELAINAKESLQSMLESAIVTGEGEFEPYKDPDCHQYMDELMLKLNDFYGDIFDTRKDKAVENFYKMLWKCLDGVRERN